MHSPLTLYPSKKRLVSFLLVTLMFTAIGIWMIQSDRTEGWFVTIFFGVCTPIFFVNLLPNAAHLRLTQEGFEDRSLFRSRFTYWHEVEGFGYATINYNPTVTYNYSQNHHGQGAGKSLVKSIIGFEGSLTSTYGKNAKELADLMNEWRNRFSR